MGALEGGRDRTPKALQLALGAGEEFGDRIEVRHTQDI
jgi:hypothetical protein